MTRPAPPVPASTPASGDSASTKTGLGRLFAGGRLTSGRFASSRLFASGRRMGIRVRSVLVAVCVVLVALLAGLAGLLIALEHELEQTADANARARVSEIVAQLSTVGLSATKEAIADSTHTNSIVQILDADGAVLQASTNDVAGKAMSSQRPPVGDYDAVEVDLDVRHGASGEWTVVTTATELGKSTYYVQAAVPISPQRDTIRTVAVFLLAGTPVLLGAVALAVWMLVGRALWSVEQIRATVADIDAHRLAQRVEVPPTRDEIAALATTMNTMLDRLEAADRAQRAFISDASHELRSPLATISTAGELAVGATPARQAELLATMNAEISRLRGLVENLMTLARADAQNLVTQHVEVDLDDLVVAETSRLRLTRELTVRADITPVRVLADQQRLAQALRNLVDNAAKHAAGTVRITLTTSGDDAIIWVDNDGPAIPAADRERVFERFVRLDEARTRDLGGSGLGLAIARATMRAHGGDASVQDAPTDWCRFELRLPRTH